jgi:hypothetical protein
MNCSNGGRSYERVLGVPHATTSGRSVGGETGSVRHKSAPNVHNTPLRAQGHRTLNAAPLAPCPPLIPFDMTYRLSQPAGKGRASVDGRRGRTHSGGSGTQAKCSAGGELRHASTSPGMRQRAPDNHWNHVQCTLMSHWIGLYQGGCTHSSAWCVGGAVYVCVTACGLAASACEGLTLVNTTRTRQGRLLTSFPSIYDVCGTEKPLECAADVYQGRVDCGATGHMVCGAELTVPVPGKDVPTSCMLCV